MLIAVHNKALRAVQLVVYLLWAPTAWATSITLGSSLAAIPPLAWLMVVILSTVSGLAALLNRLKVDTPPRLGFFLAAHMIGCWLAGILIFFAAEALSPPNTHDFLKIIAIVLGSYGGAQLMDRWANAFTDHVTSRTSKGA